MAPPNEVDRQARDLLARMRLDEKVDQMSGDQPLFPTILSMMFAYNIRPIPAGENSRLGILPILFSDGPRGVVMNHSTCFPVSMARGATWDPDLEERVGDAIGVEVRSQGANFFAGVCINILRHPAWGRAQETYGEDPHHLGEMGAALVRGVQRHAMACVKHFALNSMENARFRVDVRVDERALREIYLPHFKRCVDEGVAAVMSAYNQVNGRYCGHHRRLLREILKHEWGFDGFVISDFVFGIRDGAAAVRAGLDVEMPFTQHYGRKLRRLVETGLVPLALIDEAVLRILRGKLAFAGVGEPSRYRTTAVAGETHRALAREVAAKSIVLLKNDLITGEQSPLLPFDQGRIRRLAVIGALAATGTTGDRGSSKVRPPHVVSPLEGLRAAAGNVLIAYDDGRRPAAAAALAAAADAAVVLAGYTYRDEGENVLLWGGDRDSLALREADEAMIRTVAAANPRTAVVLIGGSAIVTESWRAAVPALLMAWYPGMEGGHAIADVLFGRVNPSGRLPCVFPRSATQLPAFDKHARWMTYDLFHGYRFLDRAGHDPAFPFGFGLSYTTYEYSRLRVEPDAIAPHDHLCVTVAVKNTGAVAGEETVQLYVGAEGSAVERAPRELKGFRKVALQPGETADIAFELPAQRLAYWDERAAGWRVEPVIYAIHVGSSSRARDLLVARFRVTDG